MMRELISAEDVEDELDGVRITIFDSELPLPLALPEVCEVEEAEEREEP